MSWIGKEKPIGRYISPLCRTRQSLQWSWGPGFSNHTRVKMIDCNDPGRHEWQLLGVMRPNIRSMHLLPGTRRDPLNSISDGDALGESPWKICGGRKTRVFDQSRVALSFLQHAFHFTMNARRLERHEQKTVILTVQWILVAKRR